MRPPLCTTVCLGLLSLSGLACASDVDADVKLCTPFKDFSNVCLFFPSENVVFTCKDRRFMSTDGADLMILQANGTLQKLCSYWAERPGTVVDDPLLQSSDDDDTDDEGDGKGPNPLHTRQMPTEDRPSSGPSAMKDKPWIPHDTRCNPENNTKVQVFKYGWYPDYDCSKPHSCIDIGRTHMPGRACCNNVDGTYTIPDPHGWEPDRTKRDLEPSAAPLEFPLQFDSRCAPGDTHTIQRFDGNSWVHEYTCPVRTTCINLRGVGACEFGAGLFYMPAAKQPKTKSVRRQDREPPLKEKMNHSWDTRCNPRNLTEIQRYNGDIDTWVLHAVCMIKGSCRDVNGIGACWLGMHHYDLPGANDTIDRVEPLPPAPILLQKKCDPTNPQQVMSYTMKGWEVAGYCIKPYVCEDFQSAGFAICVDSRVNNTQGRAMWLPWTKQHAVTSINGTDVSLVRCKSRHELVRLERNEWVHDSECTHGWVCRNHVEAPHTGGCYSLFIKALDVYQNFLASSQGSAQVGAQEKHHDKHHHKHPHEQRENRNVYGYEDLGDVEYATADGGLTSDSDREDFLRGSTMPMAPKYQGMHERRLQNPNIRPLD